MGKKYDSFIELAPGYESVVDLKADNDAAFWSRYIVTDDMVHAIKTLSKSLRPDDMNDVWHFWLKGSYGTGKTYAAIVLKHLLQDEYSVVENFLNKNKKFADVKDKFLGARKKGPYYVKFRSGECLQLNTSNRFLLQIEKSIREVLKENGFSYTGRNSLIESVRQKMRTFKSALAESFDNGEFPEYWGTYSSFNDFAVQVENGDVDACGVAQEILEALNVGLATDLDTFKAWVTDVFDGNPGLSKTGIFIIWDEFTEYIRHNDLDIIQQLSLFSKQKPLYIIYVMHEYPGLFSEDVTANMGKADARFHKIDISISYDTTRRLIGESILVKDGMKNNWMDICDDLYGTLEGNVHTFMSDPGEEMNSSELKKIFPIHPMTVELVTKVAGIAAAGRSIFMFLKDYSDDGFRAYIQKNGFDDWKWVTADYLWDYYFENNSGGKKTLTKIAEDCIKHYNKISSKISDEKALRVFKAAMLLLATVGSGQSLKKSKSSKGVQATEKTLYDCFCGAIGKEALQEYLEALSKDPINAIVMAPDLHNGYRIELPYTDMGGELDVEIENLKNNYPISKLFESDKQFGSLLKQQFVPNEKAVVKRLVVETSWGTTQGITSKYNKLKDAIEKSNHKFGLLIVAVGDTDALSKAIQTAENLSAADGSKRILICIMRHFLDSVSVDQWYEFMANSSLSQKANKTVNANSFRSQADEIITTWVPTALGKDMSVVYDGKTSLTYTNKSVISQFEKIVFKMFPYAPENFIKTNTLYKSVSIPPAYFAVTRTTLQNKNVADEGQKNFNQQWQNVVDILRENDENVWDATTIDEVIAMEETKVGRCMSALCSLLNKQLTSGTVYLTDLWEAIQTQLGYYDTSISCYLLGFAFKFFEGKFTWHDGNNAHKLDKDTIPTMIVTMCADRSAGMKISSESDVEKRFKTLTQRIFGLKDEEVGDVYECRKYVKVHITKTGYPIWAIKYLEENEFSGLKDVVCEIIDKYVDYILEIGGHNDSIEEIVELFKPNVKAYTQILVALLKDKTKLNIGMKNFIFVHSNEAKEICEKYNFSINTLTALLGRSLEEEIWQWREEKVEETIRKLVLDLRLVGIVNKAINGSAETIEKTRDTLSNFLSYIKVPGCVYANLPNEWAHAVQHLYDISINKWVGWNIEEKEAILAELEQHCSTAVDNINNPIMVLKWYIDHNGLGSFSDGEYDEILNWLPKEPFSQTENSFRGSIRKKIEELGYTKKVRALQTLWKNATGYDTLAAWVNKFLTPPEWVIPNIGGTFAVLRSLENGERVDVQRIDTAITHLQNTDMSVITDSGYVDKQFILNVSSNKNVERLSDRAGDLRNKILARFPKPSVWPFSLVAIREIVNLEVLTIIRNEAKTKMSQMTEKELRAKVEELLENSSEACLIFVKNK